MAPSCGRPGISLHCVRLSSIGRGLRPFRSGQGSSSTAWRPLACPSGEAAFGPCSPPLAAARSSSGRDPAARLAAGSLAVPFAALRVSVSRRRCVRWGPRGLRSNSRFTRGADGRPPTHHAEALLRSRVLAKLTVTSSISVTGGGGGSRPPSGRRPMALERAGPERAARGGVSMLPPERSERRETARGPTAGRPARSHAQARPRAALDAPPERPGRSPRGKTKTSLTQ